MFNSLKYKLIINNELEIKWIKKIYKTGLIYIDFIYYLDTYHYYNLNIKNNLLGIIYKIL